ncbi:hypothetical protein R1sor_012747 [Riccia sorocarpa]|uniref:DNA topoisomerase (ATP-hydrolyzing) n=1 Tax=Riccia sorocarpa TaxID=122646 RepID=A0ABD3I5T2_9MARC
MLAAPLLFSPLHYHFAIRFARLTSDVEVSTGITSGSKSGLKRGAEPGVVLNSIYKHTTLQSRFSCNMVGIINGEPMTLGLKDLLQNRGYRKEGEVPSSPVTRERTHREGDLDRLGESRSIVTIIRGAKDTHAALAGLQQELGVSNVQADALLGMPLQRLTSLERNKLLDEEKELATQIAELQQLLHSKQRVLHDQVIEKEALALKKQYGTPRLTSIEQGGDGEINDVDVIANVETLVTLSERGYIKRMAPDTFTAQNRGTVGKSGGRLRDDDALSRFFACKTHDYVLFFSERGVVYSIRAYQIPECSRTSAGNPLVQVLPLPPGERIKFGHIPGDELRWVRRAVEEDEVVISSEGGMLVRVCCGNDKLRARGRATRGVRAMKLRPGDKLAALDIVPASLLKAGEGTKRSKREEPCLLFVSKNGFGKRVPIQAFTTGGLGRMGVIGCKLKKGDSVASFMFQEVIRDSGILGADGQTEEEVVVGSHQGILNRLRVRDISVQSRTAKGVRIMRLEEGDEVKSVSLLTGHDVVVEESKVPAIEVVTV